VQCIGGKNPNGSSCTTETNYTGGITITAGGGSVSYPSAGDFSVTGLSEGTYTISYTSLPTTPGYVLTYPVSNIPPPSFTVTVGPGGTGCSVGTSNSATCDSGNNIINLRFGITNSIPWCQSSGAGNIGGNGGFDCNCSGSGCIVPTPTPNPTSVPTPTPPTCTSPETPCYSCSGAICTVSCSGSCGTTCDASCGVPAPTPPPGGGGGGGSTCIYDVDCVTGLTCNTNGGTCACSLGPTPGTCNTSTGGAGGGGNGSGGSTCIYDVDCAGGLTCNTIGSTCTCSVGGTTGTCTDGTGGAGGGNTGGGSGTGGNGSGGFNDIIPDPVTVLPQCGGAYASVPDTTSTTPGLIFTGSTRPNFGQGQASQNSSNWVTNWVVGGTNYPESFGPITQGGVIKTSYAYLQSIAKQAGILPCTNGSTSNCIIDLTSDINYCGAGGLNDCNLNTSTLAHGIYIANGNLTLTGSGTPPVSYTFPPNQSYIILVNGSLTIKTQLHLPVGSTALFSASGNIIVNRTVGESEYKSSASDIEGVFSTDQNFVIDGQNDCTIGADPKLNVAGNIIVNAALNGGKFINQRDLCAGDVFCPVFTVQSRPDFILNAPNFIKKANYTWQEVAP